MPANIKSIAEGGNFPKADFHSSEAAVAIGRGVPLRIKVAAEVSSTDRHEVAVCPDFENPDLVCTQQMIKALPGTGLAGWAGLPALPLLLGGTVVAGDLLTVSGGKFIKATTGKKCLYRAMVDGAAGDVIPGAPIGVTA